MRVLLIILLSFAGSLFSQNKITIHGTIKDKGSKEFLIGATIYSPTHEVGVLSNGYGFYSITLPKDKTVELVFNYVGYSPQKIQIDSSLKDVLLNVQLTAGVYLKEFSVEEDEVTELKNPTKKVELDIEEVKKMPNFFGEVDIIKAYQLTPGVQSGGEGRSDLFVRGGSPDQNLILLDDVPLYNVSHFGGFLSVFNADAVNDVQLIKGGFPAQYGNRLSSVLDIKMKEGNMDSIQTHLSIGLLSSKASVSTPIIKDKMSLVASVRGSLFPFFSLLSGTNYNFYDVNTKINYLVSDKDRLYLSFYKGDDVVSIRNRENSEIKTKDISSVKWGNTLISARWNHIFGPRLFSNLTAYNTRYNYRIKNEYELTTDTSNRNSEQKLTTGINDFGLKYDLSFYKSTNYTLKFGATHVFHIFSSNDEANFQEGSNIETINDNFSSAIPVHESAVYAENIWLYKNFTANVGLRLANYMVNQTQYFAPEPRISLNYTLNDKVSFQYSYSKMNQFIHLLSNSNIGLPTDFWMPSTENIRPENSVQRSLGVFYTPNKGMYKLSLEGYYKTMDNLITFLPGESLNASKENWENVVASNGTGENYGIEFFAQKVKGKTTGWISATFSRAKRRFDVINEGDFYPFKYDRIVDLSAVLVHTFGKRVSLSATWNFGTGYPTTLATEKYVIDNEYILLYGDKNNFRMDNNHRLDVAANFTKKTPWGGIRTWTLSVFNVYNRQNPYYYYYYTNYNGFELGQLQLFQQSLFGFFPSFAYSLKF